MGWWLPSHLIIAIKRFDNHGRRKYTDMVDYPVEGLDLSDIIRGGDSLDIYRGTEPEKGKTKKDTQTEERFLYDLYAVINHSGSLNYGHYTANVKFNEKWYSISDSSVSKCYGSPVERSAYILCYRQRSTRAGL